jgi:hypothetical protein
LEEGSLGKRDFRAEVDLRPGAQVELLDSRPESRSRRQETQKPVTFSSGWSSQVLARRWFGRTGGGMGGWIESMGRLIAMLRV